MQVLSRMAWFAMGVALLLTVTGCGTDSRTTNQGGGNLITAGTKLLNHNIGDLTPDEWQILGDNVPTLAAQFGIDLQGIVIPTLTDDQAAVVADFLDAHSITTIEDLQGAIDSKTITAADIPPELMELIPPEIQARM